MMQPAQKSSFTAKAHSKMANHEDFMFANYEKTYKMKRSVRKNLLKNTSSGAGL